MDVNALFASAESAFANGRYADARRLLQQVGRLAGDHPAVLHLLALVEKRSGDFAAAERAFVRSLALAPGDAQVRTNYANLLDEVGRADEALAHYGRAVAANPRFADARFNRGLLLQRLGRPDEALADFDAVLALDGRSVRAHSARASVLRTQARFAEAAAAYDRALALAPTHARALDGRARVALEAGEPGASAHFRRALGAQPNSHELILGLAEALEAEGDEGALPHLAAAVAVRPGWIEGQERLAEMRAEVADPENFTRGYSDALSKTPGDKELHLSHWRALALAGRYDEALAAIDAAALPEDDDIRLRRAIFRGEAGDPAGARDLLRLLPPTPETRMGGARAAFRLGEPDEAARLLEQVVAEQPGNIAAWAHLGLAWRLTGDARHDWLSGKPGLWDTADLDLDPAELDALATTLRTLHRTRAHPIGQSLRGGTQTRGTLFWRREPEIVRLRDAIADAIDGFVARLPPADPAHPLLRHRDARFTFAGSWSVRLQSSGFHVSHIHPKGVLSSACYVSPPPGLGGEAKDGWLDLGNPPDELGLALPPLATIEPRPGRLALFPSYLYHATRPFASGERLTVAFDVSAG